MPGKQFSNLVNPANIAACLAACAALVLAPGVAATDDVETAFRDGVAARLDEAARAFSRIAPPAAVYVGEVHDRLPYHVNQLAAITALADAGHEVAIGLEMIQTPFQDVLDDYVAGRIDFEGMLARSEYYTRWGYDPRLYQPIFEFARRNNLPLVALNAAREVTVRVREVGLAGLAGDERAALPAVLTPPGVAYRALLEDVFRQHEEAYDGGLERFIDVQLAWDETMGYTGARFLAEHPDHVLVVLAGVQHVAHGHGIPHRLTRHVRASNTIVLSTVEKETMPGSADVYLELADAELPEAGRMGVLIRSADGAVVDGFADDSPAARAGMRRDDVIVEIDGRVIDRFEDVRLALWDKSPGDVVQLAVRRGGDERVELSFELY